MKQTCKTIIRKVKHVLLKELDSFFETKNYVTKIRNIYITFGYGFLKLGLSLIRNIYITFGYGFFILVLSLIQLQMLP